MVDAVALEERDVTLLVKLLRMLAAPSVGERAAAALKVSEFVESRGLDWADLILPEGAGGMPDVQVTVAGEPMRPIDDPFTPRDTAAIRAQAQAWKQQRQAAMAAQANAAQQGLHPGGLGAAMNAGQQPYNQGLGNAMNAAAQAPNQGLGGLNAAPPGGGSSRIWNGPAQTFTYRTAQPQAVPTPAPGQHGGVVKTWQEAVVAVTMHHAHVLKGSKEEKFLEDLLRRHIPLTPKQELWLRDIAARASISWT